MREALLRRFAEARSGRGLRDDYDPSFEAVPDLVLIDGGKGQLGAALAALREAGLESVVTVVSLAKREEEVFVPWSPDPLVCAPDDLGLLLLQQGARRGPPFRARLPPQRSGRRRRRARFWINCRASGRSGRRR